MDKKGDFMQKSVGIKVKRINLIFIVAAIVIIALLTVHLFINKEIIKNKASELGKKASENNPLCAIDMRIEKENQGDGTEAVLIVFESKQEGNKIIKIQDRIVELLQQITNQ